MFGAAGVLFEPGLRQASRTPAAFVKTHLYFTSMGRDTATRCPLPLARPGAARRFHPLPSANAATSAAALVASPTPPKNPRSASQSMKRSCHVPNGRPSDRSGYVSPPVHSTVSPQTALGKLHAVLDAALSSPSQTSQVDLRLSSTRSRPVIATSWDSTHNPNPRWHSAVTYRHGRRCRRCASRCWAPPPAASP